MKQRAASLILALALVLGLVSCGRSASTWQEQYDLGVRYLSEGNYEEAIIAFTAAIEIDPKRAEAYEKAAEAYVGLGDLENALAILDSGYEATGEESLRQQKEELEGQPISSVASGGTLQYQGWRSIDIGYFTICENILAQYQNNEYAELAEYIQTELVNPIRATYPTEAITFYYGGLNADGAPAGFGISVYTEEEKNFCTAYVGTFSQGLRDGQGLLTESDSDWLWGWYIGGWEADAPNGYGEEYHSMEDTVQCSKGNSIGGLADGYWLECWYEGGSLPIEDGDEENGVTIAGYRYLCEEGVPVSMGPVPETAQWYGYGGTYGITEPAGDLMAQYYIVYENGTENYEPAPHEHAGGLNCSICQAGGTSDYHAYAPISTDEEFYPSAPEEEWYYDPTREYEQGEENGIQYHPRTQVSDNGFTDLGVSAWSSSMTSKIRRATFDTNTYPPEIDFRGIQLGDLYENVLENLGFREQGLEFIENFGMPYITIDAEDKATLSFVDVPQHYQESNITEVDIYDNQAGGWLFLQFSGGILSFVQFNSLS